MTPGMCVLCTNQHPATRGHTCDRAFDKLDDQLRQVEAETVLLSAAPSLAQRTGTRGGTLASERSPARLDVLTLTDPRTRPDWDNPALSVLGVLGGWARAVREDRQLARPERITVATERRTLAAQLDWVCAQPWVDEFAHDVRRLLGQLRAANGTAPEPPAGRCYLPADNGTCHGPIWLDQANGTAHCGHCRAQWTGAHLAHLKWELDRARAEAERPHTHDGRPMYTADELIARGAAPNTNALRVAAHRAGTKAVRGHYDPAAFGEKVSA